MSERTPVVDIVKCPNKRPASGHFQMYELKMSGRRRAADILKCPNERPAFLSFLNQVINTKPSRIKYILESNLDILNDVKDMCILTRLSNASLRKEMLILYNQKPKQWLDMQRLKKAVLILKNTNESISDIATSCGYSTVSWFIIQFKKQYKTTPFLYREQNL